MFATTAATTCAQLAGHRTDFTAVGRTAGRMCAEIYGGPQTARITGTVAGTRVRVEITRADGCGIDDWNRLVWLLGPPER
jgi:hypothetical protein